MALNDDIGLLADVPLFSGLDREQLRLIAFGAEHQRLARGSLLFEEGEPADCAYVVASGRIALSVTGRDGQRRVETVAETGTMLSELALMTATERKFRAEALESAELIRIGRPLFHRLVEEYPEMATAVEGRIRDTLGRLAQSMTAVQDRFR